jgi:hypothetical protein
MLTALTLTTNRDRNRLLRCLIEEVHGTVNSYAVFRHPRSGTRWISNRRLSAPLIRCTSRRSNDGGSAGAC